MKLYSGLVRRGHNLYIRVGLPQRYWTLTRCKEIGYSLGTSSMELGIRKWRSELPHIQKFINTFEEVCMKVFGDNKVTFNRTDVDKFLMYELERKQFFIEEHTDDLIDKKLGVKDVELYSTDDEVNHPDKVKQLMIQLVMEYLEDLVVHQKGNVTLRKTYQKLKDKELELGLTEQEDEYEWFNSFSHHLSTLEKYLRKSVTSLQDDTSYSPRSPKIVSLLRTYDEKRTKERLSQSTTHTSWEKMFKRFIRNKEKQLIQTLSYTL